MMVMMMMICHDNSHYVLHPSMHGQYAINQRFDQIQSMIRSYSINDYRRGLYGGMDIHILRSVPNAAIMFLSFELVSNWLKRQDTLLADR